MAKRRHWIPFRWLPASWGLRGLAYAEAEACYHLDGEALQRRLIDLRHADAPPAELAGRHLDLDLALGKIDACEHEKQRRELTEGPLDPRVLAELEHKHGRISDYQLDERLARLTHPADSVELAVALAELEHKHGRLSAHECAKRCASLREEPWIGIVDHGFDPAHGLNGLFFEFDWNRDWIDYLRLNGYHGATEEAVVQQWFADICRAEAQAVATLDESDA
jgi:hypothetical protein